MTTVHAYAATEAGGELLPFEYELPEIGPHEVEIDVTSCGICHSDLSMLNNDWQMTSYPFVPGHEVVGKIAAIGDHVSHLSVGQTVGLGWSSRSCMHCDQCMSGNHNLCPTAEGTIVGRHGGFADKVRAHAEWVFPIPDELDADKMGPLFCGGITVFNPIIQNNITAAHRVGVVGIGGLGHMALAFLSAWGCEVTAFSTSPGKEEEARSLGAHHFAATRDESTFERLAGSFDMILVTVNVDLPWDAYIGMLKPKGTLHLVGASHMINATVFPLIAGQKSISASPTGSPFTIRTMLDIASRKNVAPVTETFAFKEVNDAMEHLRSGKPRYRVVLKH
ncbi:NADPH-dependent aldehyde reductase Ahr [Calycomorphotria hydatis]|uniref:alcohol dehydrogenase (NADP(+)) n=1 Tax=Calycomorphotria hydatis TaxID=2528027 RepID=A0A517TB36_9PLAN|nr:NAD(P)-dependent alcohol dehydrogenase [Calycomorphotria hydatis]QDT65580.1 Aldehyde reductase Ahr [Calycomorphotria hydatis]